MHYTCFQNASHASAIISDTESTNMNAEAELNSPLVCYMILTVMWIIFINIKKCCPMIDNFIVIAVLS